MEHFEHDRNIGSSMGCNGDKEKGEDIIAEDKPDKSRREGLSSPGSVVVTERVETNSGNENTR
jgi:hypothetical protein